MIGKIGRLAAVALLFTGSGMMSARALAQAATPTAAPSLDSPIQQLDADAGTRAVLDAELPELKKSDAFNDIKVMSLRQLQGYLPQRLTPGLMARVEARLVALKWLRPAD